jgi:CheY-like chemotaxis protein
VEVELALTQPLKGVKVLVVEDNAVNQLVVTELLESWGCVVEAADNGKLGVEAFQRDNFDVILMDVQMPVMDGFDATANIRRLEADSKTHIEIIAMTANAMSGDRERCLRAGTDAYLSKPLQPSALLERLVKSAGRLLTTQARLNNEEHFVATTFDLDRLDESCSGSDALKIKVLDRYLSTSLDSIAQISQAVVGADGVAAKSAAHALKGSSLTIGSHRIGELCDELEQVSTKPGFGADQRPLAESLRAEMMALHAEVKQYLEQLRQIQK